MRINIEIPDWAKKRRILIIAGCELAAMKLPHEDFWKVKQQRCDMCGECCLNNPPTPYGLDDEGKCKKLLRDGNQWLCMAGSGRTVACLKDPVEAFETCRITYEKVN